MNTINALPLLQADRITIKEVFVEDVPATGADLIVTVKGSSFITGQTALKKAREVSVLVDALKLAGLPEEKISIETINVQASSGPILKTSSAVYTLKLNCEDLEKLGDILTVVTSTKNISLDSVEWQYGDLDTRKSRWIATVIKQATIRAQETSTALGVQIKGIHDCQLDYVGLPEPQIYQKPYHEPGAKMSSYRMGFSIGMPMQQSEEKGIRVTVVYHISK